MNVKALSQAIDKIKDNIKAFSSQFRKKQLVTVACFALLIIISIYGLMPLFSEKIEMMISEDYSYTVVEYEIPTVYSVSPLYVNSVELDQNISLKLKDEYPNIDLNYALYVHTFDGDKPNAKRFWFPIFSNGRITNFIYASKLLDDGRVTIGYTKSDIDMLQALSSLTTEDTPMYLAADAHCLYCIIGDKAYSASPLAKNGTKLPNIEISDLRLVTTILPLI